MVARFVAVPAPPNLKGIVAVGLFPRGQISERLCEHIVEVSVPQVAEQCGTSMFGSSEEEEWLDGSAPACELDTASWVVVLSFSFFFFSDEELQLCGH